MLQTNWNRRETGLVALIVATTSILLFAGFVGVPPASGARLHPQVVRVAGSMKGDFLGCPYPGGNVWQKNVAGVSPDPRSSAWLAATIAAGGDGGFEATVPTNELVNDANNATPRVPVRPKVHWHQPVSPIPWEPNFYIEPLSDGHFGDRLFVVGHAVVGALAQKELLSLRRLDRHERTRHLREI